MTMTRTQANLALLLAAFLWGAGNVAQKTILTDMGPILAVTLRCAIAFAVVLPFVIRHRGAIKQIDRHGWMLVSVSCLSFACAVTLLQMGYGHTTVTNAGFLVNVTTLMVPFAAWLLLRTRPPVIVFAAGAITLLGAYFLSGGALSRINSGDVICLASAGCYSIWMIALGEFSKRYRQACLVTALQFAATAIVTLPFAFAFERPFEVELLNALPELIMLGVASTGFAYLLQSVAQKHASAGEAAIIASAESLFGAAGGMLLLGERLDLLGWAGAALMMASILAIQIPWRGSYALPSGFRSIRLRPSTTRRSQGTSGASQLGVSPHTMSKNATAVAGLSNEFSRKLSQNRGSSVSTADFSSSVPISLRTAAATDRQ
jgi:drug/metabolite transporter (DMT)-like permease